MALAGVESVAKLEDFLLPSSAVSALLSLTETDQKLACGVDDNHIYFKGENGAIITRKLTGSFPKWEMFLPKNSDKFATVLVGELRDTTERLASVAAVAENKGRRIYLILSENEIKLTAQSAEVGGGEEFVATEYAGEPMTISIQSRFLINALRPYADDEKVKLSFKDATSSMTIEPVTPELGHTALHLIHPLRQN